VITTVNSVPHNNFSGTNPHPRNKTPIFTVFLRHAQFLAIARQSRKPIRRPRFSALFRSGKPFRG
jgi:hypothetical protein